MFQTSAPLLQTEVTVLPGIYKKKKKQFQVHTEEDRTGEQRRCLVPNAGTQLAAWQAAREMQLAECLFLHKATSRYILSVSPWKTNRDKTKILPIRNELMQAASPAY